MSFDAGALIFKIQTAGYQTFEQQMDAADRKVQQVGRSGAEAAPKVEKTGTAIEQTGRQAQSARAPLEENAKSTKKVGDESASAAPKQDKQKYSTEQQADAAKKLSTALTLTGVAIAAVVGLSVAKWTEFDQAMSNTSAAVMATAQEQKTLSEAALEAGADTAYSATEAANAQEELAKAGMEVSDIVGGSLNGALALAAAGQLQVARSAEIMATTLKQYKLPAEQAAHVSDVLAAGAGKAQGSVDDLALALSYVGPVAAGLGISLEETGGSLAYLASQGILGEKAGTGLRGVLMSLTAPSKVATETMGQYGIEIFDAQGNMKSLAEVSQILKARLGGLTEAERSAALGRIFGNEQITTARILYEGGAQAIEDWTDKVNDSGYAAEQAAMRQDNLAGDVEKLGGAFDTALIRTGSGANDVLREMVQSVTALVDWYGELPAPVQATALVLGVATGAALLFSGAAVGLRVKFVELKAQLDATNVSMGKTALVGVAAGLALTGIVTVLALFAQRQAEAQARVESFRGTLDDATGAITKSTREMVVANLQAEQSFLWMNRGSALDAAEKLGVSMDTVTDAALNQADALDELSVYLRAADGDEAALQQVMDQSGLSRMEAIDAIDLMIGGLRAQGAAVDDAKRKQDQANQVTETGAEVAKTAAGAYLEQSDAAASLENELQKLIDAIMEANDENSDAIHSNAKYQEALAGITDEVQRQKDEYERANGSLDGFSLSLDRNTEAGSANESMLTSVSDAARKAAEDQFKVNLQTMSAQDATDQYAATLSAQRQAFIDSATAAGYNADEVKALADEVFQMPDEKKLKFLVDKAQAQIDIDTFIYKNSGREVILKIGTSRVAQGIGGAGGITFADGGILKFAGGGVMAGAAGGPSEDRTVRVDARAAELFETTGVA